MVVELADVNLPLDFVRGTVLDLDGKISTVIEAAELRDGDSSAEVGTSAGLHNGGLGLGLVKGADLASVALASSHVVYKQANNTLD